MNKELPYLTQLPLLHELFEQHAVQNPELASVVGPISRNGTVYLEGEFKLNLILRDLLVMYTCELLSHTVIQ
jgi:hypothetical protein